MILKHQVVLVVHCRTFHHENCKNIFTTYCTQETFQHATHKSSIIPRKRNLLLLRKIIYQRTKGGISLTEHKIAYTLTYRTFDYIITVELTTLVGVTKPPYLHKYYSTVRSKMGCNSSNLPVYPTIFKATGTYTANEATSVVKTASSVSNFQPCD